MGRKKLPGNSLMVCQLRSLNASASNPWTERRRRKVVVLAESRFAWVDSVAEICGKALTQPRFPGLGYYHSLLHMYSLNKITDDNVHHQQNHYFPSFFIFPSSSRFYYDEKKKHLRLLYSRRPHNMNSSKNLFNATPPNK